jgi:branched-subunit amino acid transport protein
MTLLAAAVLTYLLRIAAITLVPASRLPARARRLLGHLAPAAFAALVVTGVVGREGLGALASITTYDVALLLALSTAGLVAWRVRNLAVPVLVAVCALALLEVLL